MKKVLATEDIWAMFKPVEGENAVYYGKIRNGKTRTATADILKLLQRGEIVYANWIINFDDYDERENFWLVFVKWITGRKYFFRFHANNLHYINPDELITGAGEINVNYLGRLVNVHLFIDEGQWLIPSQDRSWDEDTIAKMKLVLHGGHYCRSLNIITQRATNISKTTRSQINVWYRCVKAWDAFGWILFKKYTIEEMKDDLPLDFEPAPVDPNPSWFSIKRKQEPLGEVTRYWANKRNDPVFKAYNTHAMRGADAIESLSDFDVYVTTRWQSFKRLFSFLPWRARRARKLVSDAHARGILFSDEDTVLDVYEPYKLAQWQEWYVQSRRDPAPAPALAEGGRRKGLMRDYLDLREKTL